MVICYGLTKNCNFLILKLAALGYVAIKSPIYPPFFPLIAYNSGLLMFTRLPVIYEKYHAYNYLPIYERFVCIRGF